MQYQLKQDLIWLLLGNDAKGFKHLITNSTHSIVEAGHPSPLNTKIPFNGSKCFKKVNTELTARNLKEIVW
jgi:uracil-DNA glycosylase